MTDIRRGLSVAEMIAVEHDVGVAELRAFAAECLVREYREHGITDADIGSSDVSIRLAGLALHDTEVLREEAARLRERNELVASIAARTGKTEAETLASLQRLCNPADSTPSGSVCTASGTRVHVMGPDSTCLYCAKPLAVTALPEEKQ